MTRRITLSVACAFEIPLYCLWWSRHRMLRALRQALDTRWVMFATIAFAISFKSDAITQRYDKDMVRQLP